MKNLSKFCHRSPILPFARPANLASIPCHPQPWFQIVSIFNTSWGLRKKTLDSPLKSISKRQMRRLVWVMIKIKMSHSKSLRLSKDRTKVADRHRSNDRLLMINIRFKKSSRAFSTLAQVWFFQKIVSRCKKLSIKLMTQGIERLISSTKKCPYLIRKKSIK